MSAAQHPRRGRPSNPPTDVVTFDVTPWENTILPQPLRFAPPLADLASDPAGFSQTWQFIRYIFDLSAPDTFPHISTQLSEADLRTIRRFIGICRRLAEYGIYSSSGSVTFNFERGMEDVIVDSSTMPAEDTIVGAVTMFRQLFADDEKASYLVVSKILGRAIASSDEQHREQRQDIFKEWKKCQGMLRSRRLTALVARKTIGAQGGHEKVPVPFEHDSPTQTISLFYYGDLIHWGAKRGEHEALMGDGVFREMAKFHFVEAVITLSHFYFGFALILEAAFRSQLEQPDV